MKHNVNRYLDHAVLKPEMSIMEAAKAIQIGIDYKVRTVCVRPSDINMALELCKGSETEVCCVLSFPHGNQPSEIKAEEARLYIKKGVKEIDMVVNYSYIKSGEWELVQKDINAVAQITKAEGVTLKVIFETAMLTLEEVAKTVEICINEEADFVKTSTGFNGEGATKEVINVMLETAAGRIKVKASGGIRDFERANMFIHMGCDRLGVGYNSTQTICEAIVSTTQEGY